MRQLDYFSTVDELEHEPYPENVMTVCHYWLEEDEAHDEESEDETVPEDWISDGFDMVDAPLNSINFWPCDVLSREPDEDGVDIYEVEIFQSLTPGSETTVWHMKGYRRILENFRKEGIKFVTTPYASDQHLPGVFRSSLRIPDEMYPQAWRDLKKEEPEL